MLIVNKLIVNNISLQKETHYQKIVNNKILNEKYSSLLKYWLAPDRYEISSFLKDLGWHGGVNENQLLIPDDGYFYTNTIEKINASKKQIRVNRKYVEWAQLKVHINVIPIYYIDLFLEFVDSFQKLILLFKHNNQTNDICSAKFQDIKMETLVGYEALKEKHDKLITIYFINSFHKEIFLDFLNKFHNLFIKVGSNRDGVFNSKDISHSENDFAVSYRIGKMGKTDLRDDIRYVQKFKKHLSLYTKKKVDLDFWKKINEAFVEETFSDFFQIESLKDIKSSQLMNNRRKKAGSC